MEIQILLPGQIGRCLVLVVSSQLDTLTRPCPIRRTMLSVADLIGIAPEMNKYRDAVIAVALSRSAIGRFISPRVKLQDRSDNGVVSQGAARSATNSRVFPRRKNN